MAIIVEEEKKRTNLFSLILGVSLLVAILALVYYLFFAPTPLIEKVVSPNTQTLKELSSIRLQPEEVVNNPKFQILRQYVNPVDIGIPGKNNPFLK